MAGGGSTEMKALESRVEMLEIVEKAHVLAMQGHDGELDGLTKECTRLGKALAGAEKRIKALEKAAKPAGKAPARSAKAKGKR